MDARRYQRRSQYVVDHRGDAWQMRNILRDGWEPDETEDVGLRRNIQIDDIVRRRMAGEGRPVPAVEEEEAVRRWNRQMLERRAHENAFSRYGSQPQPRGSWLWWLMLNRR